MKNKYKKLLSKIIKWVKLNKFFVIIIVILFLFVGYQYLQNQRLLLSIEEIKNKPTPTTAPTLTSTPTPTPNPTQAPITYKGPSDRALKVAAEVVTFNNTYEKYFLDKYSTSEDSVAISKLASFLDSDPAKLAGVETEIEQAIQNRSRMIYPQPVMIIP